MATDLWLTPYWRSFASGFVQAFRDARCLLGHHMRLVPDERVIECTKCLRRSRRHDRLTLEEVGRETR